ncbi:MAG TPA: hypothetical protein DCS66_21820 [Flavobacteriaceae bacterium]|nr:hypothetical protein [Flavobacteriaceae bacterium]
MVSPFFAGALKGLEKGFAQRELKARQDVKDALALRKIVAAEKAAKYDTLIKKAKISEYVRKGKEREKKNELFTKYLKDQKKKTSEKMRGVQGKIMQRGDLEKYATQSPDVFDYDVEDVKKRRRQAFTEDVKPLVDKYNRLATDLATSDVRNKLSFAVDPDEFIKKKILTDDSLAIPDWLKQVPIELRPIIMKNRISSGRDLKEFPTPNEISTARNQLGTEKKAVKVEDAARALFTTKEKEKRALTERIAQEKRGETAKLNLAKEKILLKSKEATRLKREKFVNRVNQVGLDSAILETYSPFDINFVRDSRRPVITRKGTGEVVDQSAVNQWLTNFKAQHPEIGKGIFVTKNGVTTPERIIGGKVDDTSFRRKLVEQIENEKNKDGTPLSEAQKRARLNDEQNKRVKQNKVIENRVKKAEPKKTTFAEDVEFHKMANQPTPMFINAQRNAARKPSGKIGRSIMDSMIGRVIGDSGFLERYIATIPFLGSQLFKNQYKAIPYNFSRLNPLPGPLPPVDPKKMPPGIFELRQDLEDWNFNVVNYMQKFVPQGKGLQVRNTLEKQFGIKADTLWTNYKVETQRLVSVQRAIHKKVRADQKDLHERGRLMGDDEYRETSNRIREGQKLLQDLGNPYRLAMIANEKTYNTAEGKKMLKGLSESIRNRLNYKAPGRTTGTTVKIIGDKKNGKN